MGTEDEDKELLYLIPFLEDIFCLSDVRDQI